MQLFSRTLALFALLASSATVVNAATTVPADSVLIPSGLGAGDSFQLVFVTSTKANADTIDGTADSVDTSTVGHGTPM